MAKIVEFGGVEFSLNGFRGYTLKKFLLTVDYQKKIKHWPKKMDGKKVFAELKSELKKYDSAKDVLRAKNVKASEDKAKKDKKLLKTT